MIGKIAIKNILHKPLNSILCIVLLLFGVSIISVLLIIQNDLEAKFERDLNDIEMVMGAKGSPLQLVLSAIYHLDSPTGNISLAEAQKIMDNPVVAYSIPLAYGDSYMSYRIVGTTTAYVDKYEGKLSDGRLYEKSMEATLGADVAKRSGLNVGDTFLGTHGESESGHVHDTHPYTVVGILKKNNSVLDRLVLTEVESVWAVHEPSGESKIINPSDQPLLVNSLENSADVNEKDSQANSTTQDDTREITAVLFKFKTKFGLINLPRLINENTNMQGVLPALEINRLFHMMGIGATTLKLIAGAIILMAGLSVFFVLLGRLKERKHELALMRSVGYKPSQLFGLLILEGLILTLSGLILGLLLSRFGMFLINQQASSEYKMQFSTAWVNGEYMLIIATLLLGLISAFIPAWRAMRLDVSTILSEK